MRFRRQIRRGSVGPVPGADGTTPPTGRQAKTGEANVQQTHGKYWEAASRGVLFAGCDQGAGVAVQVTITTTATMTLHNPAGSQKRISIKKLSLVYFSGTLGAGAWYHGYLPPGSTLPSGGTALAATCTDIGNEGAVAAVGVCLAGSTVSAGKALYAFASSFPALASSVFAPSTCVEDVDGAIVLEPGAQYQLLGVFGGSGSSPKISPSIVWEEIPYVSSQG